MKLTKGMKKVVSLLLAGAMVITGANVTSQKSDAASATELYWQGEVAALGTASEDQWKKTTTATNMDPNGEEPAEEALAFNTWAGGSVGGWCGANMTATIDLSAFEEPMIDVVATGAAVSQGIEFCFEKNAGGDWLNSFKIATEEGEHTYTQPIVIPDGTADGCFVAVSPAANKNITITAVRIYDAANAAGGEGEGGDTSADPNATSFTAQLNMLEGSWKSMNDPETGALPEVTISEDGTYELKALVKEEAANLNMGWIETNLTNGSVCADFSMKINEISISSGTFYNEETDEEKTTGQRYTFSDYDDGFLCFADQQAWKVDADGDFVDAEGEKAAEPTVPGTYRLNIRNNYNPLYNPADRCTVINGTKADAFGGNDVPLDENAVITVKFTVANLNCAEDKVTYDYVAKKAADAGIDLDGYTTAYGSTASEYTEMEASVLTPSADPNASATPDASASASATPDASASASATPGSDSKATATPGSNGTKATATPAANTGSDNKVTAPAKTNKVKSVTAAKKSVTIKKKGKSATLKFKVTAANKNAVTTDKMTVKVKNKKILKVQKSTLKKGAATVKVKAKKKGKTTVTVKIGSKSAKVTVKVKK